MDEPTIDDKQKLAEIEKTLAEAEKLRAEGRAAHRSQRIGDWIEPLKLFGALVLGVGGAVAAYTQYEVAELKKKQADSDRARAEEGARAASAAAGVAASEAASASQASSRALVLQHSAEAAASAAHAELARLRADATIAIHNRNAAATEEKKLTADIARLKQELASTNLQLQSSAQQVTQARSKLDEEVLGGLKPDASNLARQLLDQAEEKGINLRLLSGYRSPEQQAALYARGRTAPGPVVTNSRVTVHSTGLAFDVGVFNGGRLSGTSKDYEALAEIGRQIGLVRPNRLDPGHFETENAQAALTQLQNP